MDGSQNHDFAHSSQPAAVHRSLVTQGKQSQYTDTYIHTHTHQHPAPSGIVTATYWCCLYATHASPSLPKLCRSAPSSTQASHGLSPELWVNMRLELLMKTKHTMQYIYIYIYIYFFNRKTIQIWCGIVTARWIHWFMHTTSAGSSTFCSTLRMAP